MLMLSNDVMRDLANNPRMLGALLIRSAFGEGRGMDSADMDPLPGWSRFAPGPVAAEQYHGRRMVGYVDSTETTYLTAVEQPGRIAYVAEGSDWVISCLSLDAGWGVGGPWGPPKIEDPRVDEALAISEPDFTHSPSSAMFDRVFPDQPPLPSLPHTSWMDSDHDWLRETALNPVSSIVRANRLAEKQRIHWEKPPEGMSALGHLVHRIEDMSLPATDEQSIPVRRDGLTVGKRLDQLELYTWGTTLDTVSDLVVELLMRSIGFVPTDSDEPLERYWTLEGTGTDLLVEKEEGGWSISRAPMDEVAQGTWIPHAEGLSNRDACIRIHLAARGPKPGLDKATAAERILALAEELRLLDPYRPQGRIENIHSSVRAMLKLPGRGGRDGDGVADTEIAAYGFETNR